MTEACIDMPRRTIIVDCGVGVRLGSERGLFGGVWQEEEDALRRQSRRDEEEGARFEIEREIEADQAMRR